jgi:hypothetical protein
VLRRCLSGFATDAEHVMVDVDGTGRIPWLDGDPRVRHRADRPKFRAGHALQEGQRRNQNDRHGTGDRSRVQTFAAEQFLAEQHASWCSAAPIHDPDSGEVLSAVDPSGPRRTSPRQPGPCPGSSRHTRERPQLRVHAQRGPTGPGRSRTVEPSCSLAAPVPPPARPASPRGADRRPARAEPAARGEPRRRCSPGV